MTELNCKHVCNYGAYIKVLYKIIKYECLLILIELLSTAVGRYEKSTTIPNTRKERVVDMHVEAYASIRNDTLQLGNSGGYHLK